MRDAAWGSIYDNEIDDFNIVVPFPSGNHEEVLLGNNGIGAITLRYDIICIKPDPCNIQLPSSEMTGNLHLYIHTCVCIYVKLKPVFEVTHTVHALLCRHM